MVNAFINFFVAFFQTKFSSLGVGLLQFLQPEPHASNIGLVKSFVG